MSDGRMWFKQIEEELAKETLDQYVSTAVSFIKEMPVVMQLMVEIRTSGRRESSPAKPCQSPAVKRKTTKFLTSLPEPPPKRRRLSTGRVSGNRK